MTVGGFLGGIFGGKAVSRRDGGLDPRLAEYLLQQASLAERQTERLDENPRSAGRSEKPKTFADHLKDAASLLASMGVLVTVCGLIVLAWDAAGDHGLVVDAFSVPSDLAERGLTGQVVARQVLDRLSYLQARSESIRAAGSYQNNWGEELKVELPHTGISIGELQRALRGWLGHETHISGEIYRASAGLTVTARVGEVKVGEFRGPEPGLENLIQGAAEAIFGRTQPYRYATYLLYNERYAEERATLVQLEKNSDPLEQAWAHKGLGVLELRQARNPAYEALEDRAALAREHNFAPALANLAVAEANLGHDRDAVLQTVRYLRAGGSVRAQVAPEQRDRLTTGVLMLQERLEGDYDGAVARARRLLSMPLDGAQADGRVALPFLLALDHNFPAARAAVSKLGDRSPFGFYRFLVSGLAALELGDPSAVTLLNQAKAMGDQGPFGPVATGRNITPWLALAEARFGDRAAAAVSIAAAPNDCYLCARIRGALAAAAGDRRGSERRFAEAISQGPDLPQAYVERGAARLAWGDTAGALADAQRAGALRPRNPDTLKLLGDILAHQGHWRQARQRYDAALALAPAWGTLRRAREIAARREG